MINRLVGSAAAASVVLLLGCQSSRNPDGSYHFVLGTGAVGGPAAQAEIGPWPYPLVPGLVAFPADGPPIAQHFVDVYRSIGTKGVASDIDRCYSRASFDIRANRGKPGEVRFCAVYDRVAYDVEQGAAAHGRRQPDPYFTPAALNDRMSANVVDAGFGNHVSDLQRVMDCGAGYAEPYLPADLAPRVSRRVQK